MGSPRMGSAENHRSSTTAPGPSSGMPLQTLVVGAVADGERFNAQPIGLGRGLLQDPSVVVGALY